MAKPVICEAGHMTIRISWSQLRIWEECAQKGMLYRKRVRATLADTRIFLPGTITDRVVRDWLLNDPEKNPGMMPHMVESILNREVEEAKADGKMTWKNLDDRDAVLRDCTEAVTRIEPHLNRLVLPFDYQPDVRFQAPIDLPTPDGGVETVLLIGAMDIMVRDAQGRFAVWDVKHTKDDGYWRKTIGQLSFYDLCTYLMQGRGTEMTGLLQPLCKEEVFPYRVTEDQRSQLLARVMRMVEGIWADDWTPRTDSSICNFCDVKHACSKFKPVSDGKNRRIALF